MDLSWEHISKTFWEQFLSSINWAIVSTEPVLFCSLCIWLHHQMFGPHTDRSSAISFLNSAYNPCLKFIWCIVVVFRVDSVKSAIMSCSVSLGVGATWATYCALWMVDWINKHKNKMCVQNETLQREKSVYKLYLLVLRFNSWKPGSRSSSVWVKLPVCEN